MIQVYYGFGKGKTTAAIGAGMRAKGAGMHVSMVQFLKDCNSCELSVLPFSVFKAPDSIPFNPDKRYQVWVDKALDYILSCESELIILDEFLDVIGSFIEEEKAVSVLNALSGREIIITGHRKNDAVFEHADYITQMKKERHPYDQGAAARKGIEF